MALVLLAVIVLPMVFDPAPRQSAPAVSIRIPSEDNTRFTPSLSPPSAPTAPAKTPESSAAPSAGAPPVAAPSKSEPAPAAPRSGPEPGTMAPRSVPETAPKVAAAPSLPSKPDSAGERERAKNALRNVEFMVPVAAFATREKLDELTKRLKAAKIPYFTEPIATSKGPVTRVRAGPYSTRDEAERAHEKLKGMGLRPGNVIARP